MITYNTTVTDEEVSVIGRDIGARIGLGAAERAAIVTAEALSASGVRLTARAIGYMVPEEGWALNGIADEGCSIGLSDLTHVDFAIADTAAWMIRITVAFTYNYSPT